MKINTIMRYAMVLSVMAFGCKSNDEPTPPDIPPVAPSGLVVTSKDNAGQLTWNKNNELDFASFNVYRGDVSGGPYTLLGNTPSTAYADNTIVKGNTYYYVASTVDKANNESEKCDEVILHTITFESIAVENFSFELPGTGKIKNWTDIPGWNSDTPPSDSGVEGDTNAPNGAWRGYLMNSDPSVWNLTGHTIASGEAFKLYVTALNSWQAPDITISLYYDNGGVRTELASHKFNLGSSYQTFELDADASSASLGHKLGIEVVNPTSGWLGFDNVLLEVGN